MAKLPAWATPAAFFAAVHALLFAATAIGLRRLEPLDVGSVLWSHKFYYENASRAAAGEVPYRDFVLEYPVLSFPLFLLPRLVAADLPTYRALFVAEMFVFDAWLIGLVASRVARREGVGQVDRRLAWYSACAVVMAPLMIGRFELAPAAIAFASADWWCGGRSGRGGVAAGLGALMKVFPGLVALPMALREWSGGGRARGTWAFTATCAACSAAWVALGGARVREAIGYQSARGLEVESLYAGFLLWAGRATGRHVPLVFNFKAYHVADAWGAGWAAASPWIQAGALLLVAWRFRRVGMTDPLRFATAAILAFVVFGKVLSPQFLIWVMPFAAALEGSVGRRARRWFLLACVATTLIYPGPGFQGLLEHRPGAIALLNVRNTLLLGLWAWLVWGPAAPGPGGGAAPGSSVNETRR